MRFLVERGSLFCIVSVTCVIILNCYILKNIIWYERNMLFSVSTISQNRWIDVLCKWRSTTRQPDLYTCSNLKHASLHIKRRPLPPLKRGRVARAPRLPGVFGELSAFFILTNLKLHNLLAEVQKKIRPPTSRILMLDIQQRPWKQNGLHPYVLHNFCPRLK